MYEVATSCGSGNDRRATYLDTPRMRSLRRRRQDGGTGRWDCVELPRPDFVAKQRRGGREQHSGLLAGDHRVDRQEPTSSLVLCHRAGNKVNGVFLVIVQG